MDIDKRKLEDTKVDAQKLLDYKTLLEIGMIIASEQEVGNIAKEIVYGIISKYKPEYVTIIFFPDEVNKSADVYAFKDSTELENEINIKDYASLKNFFLTHPNQVDFETFSFLLPQDIIQSFIKFKPDYIYPVKTVENVYGMVMLSKPKDRTSFMQDDIEFISTIINFASIALQNKKNYLKAITDLKTGLYIYHYFVQRINEEIEKFKRYDQIFSFIILDIDHFKLVNDNYGHVAGDVVLVELAALIRQSIREKIDMPVRYGGEEFGILLPRCNSVDAYKTAERLRKKIENSTLYFESKKIKYTASMGIATYRYKTKTISEFIDMADKALYYAKRSGRNRTIVNKNGKFIKYKI